MSKPRIEILEDPEGVASRAKDIFLEVALRAVADRGSCFVALAGGTSPKALYRLLGSSDTPLDWSLVHLFVSDDRVVQLEDERSNSGMVERELLSVQPVARHNWHPVVADGSSDPQEVASEYERIIREVVGSTGSSPPRFDLVLLGLGSDRHTASLFPGKQALGEERRLVVASPPGVLPPPVERVTFTLPLLNAARTVLFLSSGSDKAEAFAEVRGQLDEAPRLGHVPAARVRPADGELIWLVDRAVAP